MSLAIRMLPETLRTLAYTGITGAYATVGTPFAHPISIFLFQNQTDQLSFVSLDGVNDHFAVPSAGFILFDLTTNKTLSQGIFFSEGTQVYVRAPGSLPSLNGVSLSVLYGANASV